MNFLLTSPIFHTFFSSQRWWRSGPFQKLRAWRDCAPKPTPKPMRKAPGGPTHLSHVVSKAKFMWNATCIASLSTGPLQGTKLSRPRPLKLPNRMQLDAIISSNAFSNAIMVVIMVNVVLPLRCRAAMVCVPNSWELGIPFRQKPWCCWCLQSREKMAWCWHAMKMFPPILPPWGWVLKLMSLPNWVKKMCQSGSAQWTR